MHTEVLPSEQIRYFSNLSKTQVLGCDISQGQFNDMLNVVIQYAEGNISSYVCFANVHMLYEANNDPEFKTVVNTSNIVCPDGRPISLLMQSLNRLKQDRVCGMDFMPALLSVAERKGLKVFFYGSTDNILEAISKEVSIKLPNLQIVGSYSPPFRKLTAKEDQNVVEMINNSGAQIVFVSLGCPKQEIWMNEHIGKINSCMLGVGQAFKTFAGIEKRLPKPFRNLGVEWIYRLSIEPKRLWKRYFRSNSWFLLECLKLLMPKQNFN